MSRIFISTGEVSGDLQGALLVSALRRQAQAQGRQIEIVAIGGDRMAAAGATLLGNTSSIGSVGLFESLPFVLPTLRLQRRVKGYLRSHPPDLTVLIDYMGPNLEIGAHLRKVHPQHPMVYYIAPQHWVWERIGNPQKVLAVCDRLLAIFPREADYWQKKGAAVTWVGHPLLDKFLIPPNPLTARARLGLDPAAQVITLLPASRRQEIQHLLPVMFAAAQEVQRRLPQVQFLVPVSLPSYRDAITQAIADYGLNAQLIDASPQGDGSHDLGQAAIAAADLALSKSGTVNLEIALMNVPQVVMYRLNPVTAWIAEYIVRFSAEFISPVNLVEFKPVVPEFLQYHGTPTAVADAVVTLLTDAAARQKMLAGYASMRQALGAAPVCDRAAQEILSLLE
jgi:lipid-A-disaccharide synthase